MQLPKGLTEKIGIKYPIIQAPMAGGATTPKLIAAVANAGGLGSLGAGYMSPTEIREAIQKIRELTNRPFAVNLFIPQKYNATPKQIEKASNDISACCAELNIKIQATDKPYAPLFEEQIKIILEEKVPIFSFTFGIPDATWIAALKSNHTILIGTATTAPEARALEKNGIDMIVAQGSEAGGHRGSFIGDAKDGLIELAILLPQLIDQIKTPLIAAGGMMDGRGIAASMALGAAGVQMGTAFLSCPESGIHTQYKQTLLKQQQDNTILTRAFSGKLARSINNKFTACMRTKEENILDYPIQSTLTQPMLKKAKETDHIDFMSMWAGQSAQLSRGISAAELINQLLTEIGEAK